MPRKQISFIDNNTYTFEVYESMDVFNLVSKMKSLENIRELGTLFDTTSGFGGKSKLITETKVAPNQIGVMKGDSIERYGIRQTYWFDFRAENLTGRTRDITKLGAIPKILLRKTGNSMIATYDDSGVYPEQSLYFLFNNKTLLSIKYYLGILNSKLLNFYFRVKALTNEESIAQVKNSDLNMLPLKILDLNNKTDNETHSYMVKLVDERLKLPQQLVLTKSSQDRKMIERQITATERQIDQFVYRLYNLTPDEIALVEGSN